MLPALLEQLRVARIGPGRPRTTPTALLGDKAYSSRGTRAMLRARGITAVITCEMRRAMPGRGGPRHHPAVAASRSVFLREYRGAVRVRSSALKAGGAAPTPHR